MAALLVAENRTLHQNLGRYLARARNRLGITQEELAARLGVTQTFVARVEAGKRRPALTDFPRWATELGVPESELLHEAGAIRDPDALPRPSEQDALDRWWQSLPLRVRQQLRQTADAWLIEPVLDPRPMPEDEPD